MQSITLLLVLLCAAIYSQPVPQDLYVEEDDRVATLGWDDPEERDLPNGVEGKWF